MVVVLEAAPVVLFLVAPLLPQRTRVRWVLHVRVQPIRFFDGTVAQHFILRGTGAHVVAVFDLAGGDGADVRVFADQPKQGVVGEVSRVEALAVPAPRRRRESEQRSGPAIVEHA